MTQFIADVDLAGQEMERPFMRFFVDAPDEELALEQARAQVEAGETVRGVRQLQPILEQVIAGIAAGGSYGISFKHESGTEGPVWIIEDQVAGEGPVAVPFGTEAPGITSLPWMRLRDARRLASYVGLPLDES